MQQYAMSSQRTLEAAVAVLGARGIRAGAGPGRLGAPVVLTVPDADDEDAVDRMVHDVDANATGFGG